MNSVAWWPHTANQKVASARLRCFQVVEELKRQGVDAGVYAPGQPAPQTLILSKRYDAASVRHALTLRRDSGTRVVLDLCDNHFHVSSDDPRWQARAAALKGAVTTVDKVIASTPTLQEFIVQACPEHPDIAVVGDAVEPPTHPAVSLRPGALNAELQLARLARAIARSGVAEGRRLLWFGNHGSGHAEGGMADLLLISERLERVNDRQPISLTVISNSKEKYRQLARQWAFRTHYLEWNARTFSRAALLHDIAVIPIGKNPFTLCKTNNRVATAFMHRLAVAADAIPSYDAFSASAVLDDWEQGFAQLMEDHSSRKARIERGMSLVEQHWSLQAIKGEWMRALGLSVRCGDFDPPKKLTRGLPLP
jgi:hypothetical protein